MVFLVMFLLSPTSSGAMWCSTLFYFFIFFNGQVFCIFPHLYPVLWLVHKFSFFSFIESYSHAWLCIWLFSIYLMIFFDIQVVSRWEKFLSKVKHQGGNTGNVADIQQHFPFHKFFENAPQVGTKMGNTHRYTKEIPGKCGHNFQTWELRSWFCHEIWN